MFLLCNLVSLYTIAIFGRMVFSFFPNVSGTAAQIARFIYNITEPLLAPIRRALPFGGPLDFSPIILLIALQVVQGVLLPC
jgi:YggT family protein